MGKVFAGTEDLLCQPSYWRASSLASAASAHSLGADQSDDNRAIVTFVRCVGRECGVWLYNPCEYWQSACITSRHDQSNGSVSSNIISALAETVELLSLGHWANQHFPCPTGLLFNFLNKRSSTRSDSALCGNFHSCNLPSSSWTWFCQSA